MKTTSNHYQYTLSHNTTSHGFFNIYQARSGKIYLQMGDSATDLEFDQVVRLDIDVYSLQDFDYDLFRDAYGIERSDQQ